MGKVRIERFKQTVIDGTLKALAKRLPAIAAEQMSQVNRSFVNGGQPSSKWPSIKPIGGFRDGGQPLRSDGGLKASFHIEWPETGVFGNRARSTIASGSTYAPYHQTGFKTSGPNYIPLTLKGRRLHHPGADPAKEGLKRGVDYVMAWKGVSVPARPMIDYSDPVNAQMIRNELRTA